MIVRGARSYHCSKPKTIQPNRQEIMGDLASNPAFNGSGSMLIVHVAAADDVDGVLIDGKAAADLSDFLFVHD